MSAPLRIDALDVPAAELERRLAAGQRSEYSHLLHDADPDSTVPAFPYLIKARKADIR